MEKLAGGLSGGAGSPDVVNDDVGGAGVDFGFGIEGVGGGGLGFASGRVGADLDGVLGADEKARDVAIGAEACEMLSDEIGVVKTTFADVATDGGERNDDGFFGGG